MICPECGSSQIDKAGFRYLADDTPVQRFICKKCGHRFSEKSYNLSETNRGISQLCAILEAKKLDSATELKTVAGEKGQLVEYAWKLKKRGLNDRTIKGRMYLLNQLLQLGVELNNPDSVETVLATEKITACKKHRLVSAYTSYAKVFRIAWDPVKTNYTPKQPFVPLESELDVFISAAGKTTAAFLQAAKDTGARSGEIAKLKWTDIDTEKKTVSINTPEKNSNSRTLKVEAKTIAMINALPKKYDPYIFNPNPAVARRVFCNLRRQVAKRLQNPRLKRIHLHSFRHWKATMEYAKTKNLVWVKHVLGHRSIKNTEIYTHLCDFSSEEYHSATAKTVDEARKLIESGFSYVCDMEGVKLFSKRK
ncbi:tyrosine-type recombinase/integrase [Candidatus Bathyarchaeota archaeon]|nr:tyrosine-type recombinase/integrase [Candidatus Bathyarchaeota archaeon]